MEEEKEEEMEEEKEIEKPIIESEEIDRTELNIQQFMNDMALIGDQVRSKELVKPVFHYGDLAVTNYLLWLMLGELMMLNNNINGGEE